MKTIFIFHENDIHFSDQSRGTQDAFRSRRKNKKGSAGTPLVPASFLSSLPAPPSENRRMGFSFLSDGPAQFLFPEALPEKMTQKNCRRGSYFFALLTILTSRIIFSRSFSPSISAPLEISTPYG